MIISKTPYRISLFGGGSDYPSWYLRYGGEVISFAINKYCYLTTRILPPFFEHKYRIAYSRVENTSEISQIVHPVVREALRLYSSSSGLEIHHDGDLPARSGMGSSSAFAVGLIHSLLSLKNIEVERTTLAKYAINLEQNILKENVGSQDQIACAIGGINNIEFRTNGEWHANPIELNVNKLQELESRLALVFSGQQRLSSRVSTSFLGNGLLSEQALLRNIKLSKLCTEIFRSNGDFDNIGEMLNESWQLKKTINPNTSNLNLENLKEQGMNSGAIGAKVLGAGGGGFILFWLKSGHFEYFRKKLFNRLVIPVKISQTGSTIIFKES